MSADLFGELNVTQLLDPPWKERGGGQVKRGADRHYPLVPTKDLPRVIRSSPEWRPDPAGCSVWMWTTANFLGDAMWLLAELGCEYVTNVVWVKGYEVATCGECGRPLVGEDGQLHAIRERCRSCRRVVDVVWLYRFEPPGLGQRFRMLHEHLLYARFGAVPVPAPENRLPSVIVAPRGRHSEKPEAFYRLIERHDPAGRRAELFARVARPGWHRWGFDAPPDEADAA